MLKRISKFIFWLFGWRTEGVVPPLKKFVVIAAPHTSAWDAVFGLCAKYLFDVDLTFFGKEELFRFPTGIFFRAIGGIGVDRFSNNNVVDKAVELFNSREHFILGLSPEGTRKYVAEWRTGFYYIAMEAKVPIVMAYLDFEHKVVGIGPTVYPTGNIDRDIEEMKNFYRPIKGKHPEKGVR